MLGKRAIQGREKLSTPPVDEWTSSIPDQFAEICGSCFSAPVGGACDSDTPAGSGCFPSINNQALSALNRANAAPSSETSRKALTNDSSIACLSAACVSPLTLGGMVM